MADRKATATWNGGLKDGKGTVALGSGFFKGAFSFGTEWAKSREQTLRSCWRPRLQVATRWH